MTPDRQRRMLIKLIQAFAHYGSTMKSGRPTIDFKLAKARFEGMNEMVAEAFEQSTPFKVELDLIELEREHGKAPMFSALNREYKEWESKMFAGLTYKLGLDLTRK